MDTDRSEERLIAGEEPTPTLLTVREAAERLTISEATLWHHLQSGALPGCRIGGVVRIRAADVNSFITPYEVRSR